MTGHASRATVDFDAFERELRQTSQEAIRAKAPQAAPKGDPLAELCQREVATSAMVADPVPEHDRVVLRAVLWSVHGATSLLARCRHKA